MLTKTGEKGASQAVLDESPIPVIPGMNIYEECWIDRNVAELNTPSLPYILAEANRQKYRITICVCGGPRIHSKTSGRSKCFQCENVETAAAPLASRTRQRCKRCKKFRWAVLKANYCGECYERVQKQKAHLS